MRVRFVRPLAAATTSAAIAVAALLPQLSGGNPAELRNSIDGRSAADSQGDLHVPKDYRGAYEYLGSYVGLHNLAPGPGAMKVVRGPSGTRRFHTGSAANCALLKSRG